MEANSSAFNPEMLVLRRESLGLTQSELAKRVSVSQAKLSRLEAGFLEPDPEFVAQLARSLGRPEEFFYQKEPIFGPGVSEFYHRKRQAVGARPLRQTHAKMNEDLIVVRRLLRSAEIEVDGFSVFDDLEDLSPTEAARAVRATWALPPGPVRSMTRSIENAGGIVVPSEFPSKKIDAVSRWVRGLPPVFFLNMEVPGDRQRYSLAHELGHMLLHRAPHPEMEEEADQFAAEFLMPAREIRADLANVSISQLAALKPHWRVSMQALLYRAGELGLISERKKRYMWMRLGQLGYRKREPAELDVATEEPSLFREILSLYRDDFEFSVDQLARFLHLEPGELKGRYGISIRPQIDGHSHLRVVG